MCPTSSISGRLRSNAAAARAELEGSEASRARRCASRSPPRWRSRISLRSLDEQVALTRKRRPARAGARAAEAAAAGRRDLAVRAALAQAEAAVVRASCRRSSASASAKRWRLRSCSGARPKRSFEGKVTVRQAYDEARAAPGALRAALRAPLRRPDLVEAERQLAAANAHIGVARAEDVPVDLPDRVPRQRKPGAVESVLRRPAATWQIAAAVTQPIFSGGRLAARTDAAEARSAPRWRNTSRHPQRLRRGAHAPSPRCARARATTPNRRAPPRWRDPAPRAPAPPERRREPARRARRRARPARGVDRSHRGPCARTARGRGPVPRPGRQHAVGARIRVFLASLRRTAWRRLAARPGGAPPLSRAGISGSARRPQPPACLCGPRPSVLPPATRYVGPLQAPPRLGGVVCASARCIGVTMVFNRAA